MLPFLRKNFAFGYLKTSMSPNDVQVVVTVGHSLPVVEGKFRLVIWDAVNFPDPSDDSNLEIVTAEYSGILNVYDIVRAQEGTSSVSHGVGSKVALHYTAGISEDDLFRIGNIEVDDVEPAEDEVLMFNGQAYTPVLISSQLIYRATYGETISALKVVYFNAGKVYIAKSNEVTQANRIIGITIEAKNINDIGKVQLFGFLSDASWDWDETLPIFFDGNGTLTQNPPTSGFSCQVASATDSNQIKISIQPSIILET